MFRDCYWFDANDKIAAGIKVKCFDKLDGELLDLSELNVAEYFDLMMNAKNDDTNRFVFYYEAEKDKS